MTTFTGVYPVSSAIYSFERFLKALSFITCCCEDGNESIICSMISPESWSGGCPEEILCISSIFSQLSIADERTVAIVASCTASVASPESLPRIEAAMRHEFFSDFSFSHQSTMYRRRNIFVEIRTKKFCNEVQK